MKSRLVFLLGACVLSGASALAAHIGWFSKPRPWPQATGYARIPESEIPRDSSMPIPELTLWWLGHSGFFIQWAGSTWLLDPNRSPFCTISKNILQGGSSQAPLSRADFLLVSHAHPDHMDLPTIETLAGIHTVLLPAGAEIHLPGEWKKSRRVVTMNAGETFRAGEFSVTAIPTLHHGNRYHPFPCDVPALGFVIEHQGDRIYYAGDTGYGPHLKEIGRKFKPQIAILPIGGFSPRMILKHYHLSPEEAVEAAADLACEVVIPCHFGTFAVSLDSPDQALPRFSRSAHEKGVHWVMPRLWGEEPMERRLREVSRP